MESEEVRKIISDTIQPLQGQLNKIEKAVEPLPVFLEKMKTYDDIENSVSCHEFILRGVDGKEGMVCDFKKLKDKVDNQSKKIFNWIIKVAALAGTILGLFATIRTFF